MVTFWLNILNANSYFCLVVLPQFLFVCFFFISLNFGGLIGSANLIANPCPEEAYITPTDMEKPCFFLVLCICCELFLFL